MPYSKASREFISSAPLAARHYMIVCSACGWRQDDDGVILDCPRSHAPALLRTEYRSQKFSPRPELNGLFRYQDWLPVGGASAQAGKTVVYQSQGLARALEMRNLWIAFNGYWPERGAALETATFKELEAYTVLARLSAHRSFLTVASSGNTGTAFAWACSRRQVPCLIVVPEKSLHRFRFQAPLDSCVKIVAVEGGDYADAMEFAAAVSARPYFQAEGGVKNVGRRDGLATVLLAAFDEMQCLPTHYFQAVGSGTGAIAVLEAARRLAASSGTDKIPKLMLCQNLPFTPIYDAWSVNSKSLLKGSTDQFREAVRLVHADELTNWKPPYEIRGGLYDSLVATRGDVLVADNASVRIAMDMFLETEGIDIEPAAGVALACLRDAVADGKVGAESTVLLNVTGGGRRRLSNDYALIPAQVDLRVARDSLYSAGTVEQIAALPFE